MLVKIMDYYGEEYVVTQEFAEDFYAVSKDLDVENFPIELLWESCHEYEYDELSTEGKERVIESIYTWNQYLKK